MMIAEDLPKLVAQVVLTLEARQRNRAEAILLTIDSDTPVAINRAQLVIGEEEEARIRGWYELEQILLKHCNARFGVGRYASIHSGNFLRKRSTQQLYTQTQRIIGQQSISEFSGIRLDVNEVKCFNRSRHEVGFYLERKHFSIITCDWIRGFLTSSFFSKR